MSKLYKGERKSYTIVSGNIPRDKKLGLKARGMLLTLISLPDGWEFSEVGLVEIFTERDKKGNIVYRTEARDSIRSALKKLEDLGYLRRVQKRGPRGVFISADYYIYEEPQPLLENPTTDKPTSGSPTLAEPILEEPLLEEATEYNTDESNTDISSNNQSITDKGIIESSKSMSKEEKTKTLKTKKTKPEGEGSAYLEDKIKFLKNKFESEWAGWWRMSIENPHFSEERRVEQKEKYEFVLACLASAFEYEQLHQVSVDVFVGYIMKIDYIKSSKHKNAYIKSLLPEILEKAIKERERRDPNAPQHFYHQGVAPEVQVFSMKIENPDAKGVDADLFKQDFDMHIKNHVSAITYDLWFKNVEVKIMDSGVELFFETKSGLERAENYRDRVVESVEQTLLSISEQGMEG